MRMRTEYTAELFRPYLYAAAITVVWVALVIGLGMFCSYHGFPPASWFGG